VLAKILTPEPKWDFIAFSVGGALTTCGELLGPRPVNLNYTAGPQAIDAAVQKPALRESSEPEAA